MDNVGGNAVCFGVWAYRDGSFLRSCGGWIDVKRWVWIAIDARGLENLRDIHSMVGHFGGFLYEGEQPGVNRSSSQGCSAGTGGTADTQSALFCQPLHILHILPPFSHLFTSIPFSILFNLSLIISQWLLLKVTLFCVWRTLSSVCEGSSGHVYKMLTCLQQTSRLVGMNEPEVKWC